MPVKIQTVNTDAFTMDYFQFGCGKETLVILPGLSVQSVMGCADSVAEAYQVFTDDYTIYVFDRRQELPPTYSVYEMAHDTAEAFRVLGLSEVNLFGASQGGMIAMKIAIDHPELVRKLVLGSTSACVEEAQYQVIEKWIQLAKSGDATGLYMAFGEAIYPEDVFEQSRALLAEAAETVTDDDLKRFIILAEGTKGFEVTDDLERISCPVFVIGSKDDQVLGGEASKLIMKHLTLHAELYMYVAEGMQAFEETNDLEIIACPVLAINSKDDQVLGGEVSERIEKPLTFRAQLYMYDGYGHAVFDTAPDYKDKIQSFLKTAQTAL